MGSHFFSFSTLLPAALCLLLLAIHSLQQFHHWSTAVRVSGRDIRAFRQCCFGQPRHYLLCAFGYYFFNALVYAAMIGFGLLAGASPDTLLLAALTAVIGLTSIPGLNRPFAALRYFLQRHVFRPALPSPAEQRALDTLQNDPAAFCPLPPSTAVDDSDWGKLLFLSDRLQARLDREPRRRADIAELADLVHEKVTALRRRNRHDRQLLSPLLSCCYLAIIRTARWRQNDRDRQTLLRDFGLVIDDLAPRRSYDSHTRAH